jgi:hypothetical protein
VSSTDATSVERYEVAIAEYDRQIAKLDKEMLGIELCIVTIACLLTILFIFNLLSLRIRCRINH